MGKSWESQLTNVIRAFSLASLDSGRPLGGFRPASCFFWLDNRAAWMNHLPANPAPRWEVSPGHRSAGFPTRTVNQGGAYDCFQEGYPLHSSNAHACVTFGVADQNHSSPSSIYRDRRQERHAERTQCSGRGRTLGGLWKYYQHRAAAASRAQHTGQRSPAGVSERLARAV